jgi:hypothetical protein
MSYLPPSACQRVERRQWTRSALLIASGFLRRGTPLSGALALRLGKPILG